MERNINELRPFFTFFGSKWRVAPHYPTPIHNILVEPFAGSAGYSLRYPNKQVLLVEKDPFIAGVWKYLIRSKPQDILLLPDIGLEQNVDDLSVCQEAKWMIGFWLSSAQARPAKKLSAWAKRQRAGGGWKTGGGSWSWSLKVRLRIAKQLATIRHWKIIEGSYEDIPNGEATWFIDPPYQIAGSTYRLGSKTIDYPFLAQWCKSRLGQVMVCENVGATWLPFRPFRNIQARPKMGSGRKSKEAIWSRRALPSRSLE